MRTFLRALAVGAVLIALIAALAAHPAVAEAAGVDFWHVPELRFTADQAAAEERDLDRIGEQTLHRTMIRYETMRDVAEGRLSFEEGVARFVQLNRAAPGNRAAREQLFGGETEEELAGWQLVGHLRTNAHLHADAVADALACWLVERK
jgi:hypothetical protein